MLNAFRYFLFLGLAALGESAGMSSSDVKRIMSFFDESQSGKIDRNEFRRSMRKQVRVSDFQHFFNNANPRSNRYDDNWNSMNDNDEDMFGLDQGKYSKRTLFRKM